MKTITVKGMSCQHCAMAVTKALNGIDGINEVTVDLETGRVTFEETQVVAPETIATAIKKAGYDVTG